MKTIKTRSLWVLVCSLLLLGTLTGCKNEESARNAPSESGRFALEKVAVADLGDSKPMVLNRAGIENVLSGKVTIGDAKLTAYIMDLPARDGQTSQEKIMYLYPDGHTPQDRPLYWRTNDPRQSYQQIDGMLYSCSLAKDHSAIIATAYQGDSGTLRLGCADRTVKDMKIARCMLRSADKAIMFDNLSSDGCAVPVGEYTSANVTVDYDTLRVSASNNRYKDAGLTEKSSVEPLKIEKDQTITCDFSGTPKVLFTKVTNDKEFSPGDEVEMATVLVDTKTNMMVSGLNDTSQKETRELKNREGNVIQTYEVDKALVPTVQIARADGTVVAEGQMPFG